MRDLCFCGIVTALCLSLPAAARAQGIPDIVITPTRFAQSLIDVVVPTRVITRTQIEASGASTVAGVLQFYPGFDIKRLGGPGQQTSVFVQGTGSEMVKVLIDGVPVNDPNAGTVPWAQIPVHDIQRIEVVSGPLSSIWGADAIGGVINIITRQPIGNGGSLTVGAGNWGTRDGTLSLHGSSGQATAGVSLSGEHTAGQPVIRALNAPAPYDNHTLSAYANTRLGRVALHANAWQSRGRTAYANGYPPSSPYVLANKVYLNQTARIGSSLSLNPRWLLKGGVEQTRHRTDFHDGTGYFTRSTRNAFNTVLRYSHAGISLAFGSSIAKTRISSQQYGGYRKVRSMYLDLHQRVRGATLTEAGRRTLDAQYGGYDTWNLGVALPLPGAARFKLSAGTGFTPPTLLDLYYPHYSNPNLRPETSRSVEAQLLLPLGRSVIVTLTAYRNRLYNLIESNQAYVPENVGNAIIRGFEGQWTWTSGWWTVRAAGTWQNPRNLDTGSLLVQRARHTYQLRIRWHRQMVRWGAAWVYEGRRLAANGMRLAPYRILNLTAAYRLDRRCSANLRITNALDTAYATGYTTGTYYLGARRSAWLSLTYRFGEV